MRLSSPKLLWLVTCALITTLLLLVWDSRRKGDNIPLGPRPIHKRLVTPATRSFIGQVLKNNSINGFSLVIARPGTSEPLEYGNWGTQNEEGDPVTQKVSLSVKRLNLGIISCLSADSLYDWFYHEGVRCHCCWNFDG